MSNAYDYSSGLAPITGVNGAPASAFIFHHTGGGGDVAGVQQTLKDRGLGVQYVMDRDGNITQTGGPGSQHMMTGWGAGNGLSNANTVGMEVIAKNDKDVTPAQVQSAQKFIQQYYPNTPVFGHGEVNPGHKEADEGATITNAIRAAQPQQPLAQPQQGPNPAPSITDVLAKLKGGGGNGAGAAAADLISQGSTPTFANPNGPTQAPGGTDISSLLGLLGKGGGGGSASGTLGSVAGALLKAGQPQQAPQPQNTLTPQMLEAMTQPSRPIPLNIPKLIGS